MRAVARPVLSLVTDGGEADAKRWAEVTADGLITMNRDIVPAHIPAALRLRAGIVSVLEDAFRAVKDDWVPIQAQTMADAVWERVLKRAALSPWDHWFHQDLVTQQMKLVISRNLWSAVTSKR